MKNHSKKAIKQLEKQREKRDDIRTMHTYGRSFKKKILKKPLKIKGKPIARDDSTKSTVSTPSILLKKQKRKNENRNVSEVKKKKIKK